MASIHKHPGGESKNWYCSFTLSDGRRTFRSTGTSDKNEAQLTCSKWATAAKEGRKGRFVEAQARKVLNEILESSGQGGLKRETVETFLRGWVESKEVSKSEGTAKRYKHTVGEFLRHLGGRAKESLSHVTARDIENFRDAQKKEGRTASTVNMALKTLRIPFNKAHKQGVILSNPAASSELLRAEISIRAPFTLEQVRALLTAAESEWRGLILVGATAGLRLGDASRLSWESIDFERKLIRYLPQKTKAARTKPLEVVMLPDLEEYLLALPLKGHKANSPLFPKLSKMRLSGSAGLSALFQRIMHKAGIFAEKDGRQRAGKGRSFNNLTFHSLRHTYVSLMANCGVTKEVRMKLAGHTSDAHERYTHLEIETMRGALSDFPSFSNRD